MNRLSPRTTILLIATGAALLLAVTPVLAAPTARTSRVLTLNERGQLHVTSRHGFTLDEQGPATGTLTGTIYVHLRIVSTTQVLAEVNIYAQGGSVSCHAHANYRRGSQTASFLGTLSIDRGTGSYARARGGHLGFSGTIRRSDEAIDVRVSGTATE